MNIFQQFKNNWCWTCLAKAGFAVGLVSILMGRNNPMVPLLAIILCLTALIFRKRETDMNKRGQLVFLGYSGLTLGILMFIIGLFRS